MRKPRRVHGVYLYTPAKPGSAFARPRPPRFPCINKLSPHNPPSPPDDPKLGTWRERFNLLGYHGRYP